MKISCTHEVIEDLVSYDARHFEALLAGDRVDNHVAMDADEVLGIEDAVLILHYVGLVSGILRSLSRIARTRNEAMLGQWGVWARMVGCGDAHVG